MSDHNMPQQGWFALVAAWLAAYVAPYMPGILVMLTCVLTLLQIIITIKRLLRPRCEPWQAPQDSDNTPL